MTRLGSGEVESNEGGKWRSGNVMRFEVESDKVWKWRVTRLRSRE